MVRDVPGHGLYVPALRPGPLDGKGRNSRVVIGQKREASRGCEGVGVARETMGCLSFRRQQPAILFARSLAPDPASASLVRLLPFSVLLPAPPSHI